MIYVPIRKKCGTDFRNFDFNNFGDFFNHRVPLATVLSRPTDHASLLNISWWYKLCDDSFRPFSVKPGEDSVERPTLTFCVRLTWRCPFRPSADVCVELYSSFRHKLSKVLPQLCDGSTIILTFLVIVVVVVVTGSSLSPGWPLRRRFPRG